ncbi:MAG: GNAT family N-acetyltransferase [Sulfurovum sp.]|nr:GNAT family N-acetyltransferase [Sulfurovum sp.]
MKSNFKWIDNCDDINWKDLSHLYSIAPLGDKPVDMLQTAFTNSAFTYFVYDDALLIGVGRALADGVDSAYLCDIAIHPEYQGLGLGKAITQKLLDSVKGYSKIILFANIGKESFYEQLGFAKMTTAMAIFKHQDKMREIGLINEKE